ncbi:hypothetical protein Hanom_Chr00s021341g01760761 [Helianthus anomalus]
MTVSCYFSMEVWLLSLVLKSERCIKATASKTEARSAKHKSGGLFVPKAQSDYITFYIYLVGFSIPYS